MLLEREKAKHENLVLMKWSFFLRALEIIKSRVYYSPRVFLFSKFIPFLRILYIMKTSANITYNKQFVWRILKQPGLDSSALYISVFQDRPDRGA